MDEIVEDIEVKVYKRRWIMLLLMVVNSGLIVFHINQYSSATNVMSKYYNVSDTAVVLSCSIGGIVYAVLCYFCIKILRVQGLRYSMVLSTFMSAIGACIKCFGTKRDSFYIILIAQLFPAIAQCFCVTVTPVLAAHWFRNDETATVVGANAAFQMLANMICFTLPKFVFKDKTAEGVSTRLKELSIIETVTASVLFLAVVAIFKSKPKNPPSISQQKKEFSPEIVSPKLLLKNRDYILLSASLALSAAFDYSFSAVMNQIVYSEFPKHRSRIEAFVGCLLMIFGFVGSLLVPYILDKCKKFKLVVFASFTLSVVFFGCIQISLWLRNLYALYISASIFGLVFYGRYGVITDLIVEVTYPIPPTTSFGIASFFVAVLSASMIEITSNFLTHVGVNIGLFLLFGILINTLILPLFCKWDLKRQTVEAQNASLNIQATDEDIEPIIQSTVEQC